MAEINLGAIKFNWKGAYAGGTAYVVDDVVESGGSSYVCILASTNNTPPNGTYWNLMAQGGTGSASTLTTAGDMLYRDGSGLQRLGIGTAAQELRVNSGANAPEWHTPAAVASGGLVPIKTQIITSTVSSVDFINGTNGVVFDGTYKFYKVIYDGLNVSGAAQNGTRFEGGSGNDSRISLSARNASHATQANTVGEFILSNPIDTTKYKALSGYSGGFGGNAGGENYQTGGVSAINTTAINGFRFIPYSGTIDTVTATLFGIASS